MNLLSSFTNETSTDFSNKSGFNLYLGTSELLDQKTNQSYSNSIYITNLDELIKVTRNYSNTPNCFKDGKRLKDNWLKTNCLIIDIDNKESENSYDWLTISDASKMIGVTHYVIPSKSHLKQKLKDGKPIEGEGFSPRPRYHIYIPTNETIEDVNTFEYLSKTIKDYFTIDENCLLDSSVSGRSGTFFSSPNIDLNECYYVERNTDFKDWIKSISRVSLDEFSNPKVRKTKGDFSSKTLSNITTDENLKFLGKYGFLVKSYPNNNGTFQIQFLNEKTKGGYFYDPLNKKIWKYDSSSSGKSWSVYEFLKEFSPNEIKKYEEYRNIEVRDEKVTRDKFKKFTEVLPAVREVTDTFFNEDKNIILGGTEGSGKSTIIREKIKKYIEETNRNVGVFVPTNELGSEWIYKLKEIGIKAEDIIRISGRSFGDNCIEPDIDSKSEELSKKGESVAYSLCNKCPLFKECNYYKQFENYNRFSRGKVFVMVRNYLTINLPDFIIPPSIDKIVIDENPIPFMSSDNEDISVKELKNVFESYKLFGGNRLGWNSKIVAKYETFLSLLKECSSIYDLVRYLSEFSREDYKEFKGLYKTIWSIESTKNVVYRVDRFNSGRLFNYLLKLSRNKDFRGLKFNGDTFTLLGTKTVRDHFKNKPTLVLDSNVRPSKGRVLSDVFKKEFESFNFDIEPNVNIVHVNKTFSKITLEDESFNFDKEIGNLVKKIEGKKVLFFIRKDLTEKLRTYLETTKLSNYDIRFQGGIRGLDKWSDYDTCVYIGWFLEPVYSVIDRYNSIYPNDPLKKEFLDYDERLVEVISLDGSKSEVLQKFLKYEEDKVIEERLNELLKESLFDEMSQSISRLRFIYSEKPKDVYILNTQLTNFPIKKIYEPSKFRDLNDTELDNRLKKLLDRTDFNNDVLILDYKVVGDLFKTIDSFKTWRSRTFGVTNPFINIIIGKSYSKLKLYKYCWGRGKNEYFVFSSKTYLETKVFIEDNYLNVLGVSSIRTIDTEVNKTIETIEDKETRDFNTSFNYFINNPRDSIQLKPNIDVTALNIDFENRFIRDDFG